MRFDPAPRTWRRGDAAGKWVAKARNSNISYEELGVVPKEFITLDRKLAAALQRQCSGDFGARIEHLSALRLESEGVPISSLLILPKNLRVA